MRIGGELAHRGRRLMKSRGIAKSARPRHVGMVSRNEVRRQVEVGAHSLGMSLDEFYQRLDAGTLPDTPAVVHLQMLAGARRH
jgi:hypothetical protein